MTSPPAPTPRVAIIGDSLTFDARPYLPVTNYFTVNGLKGRALNESHTLIRNVVATQQPKVLVIALGSNDVDQRNSEATMLNNIQIAAKSAASVPDVLWTTVKVQGVTSFYARGQWVTYARNWNRLLINAYPPTKLANWRDIAHSRPGLFVADGLHMNLQGRKVYANFLKARIDAALKRQALAEAAAAQAAAEQPVQEEPVPVE